MRRCLKKLFHRESKRENKNLEKRKRIDNENKKEKKVWNLIIEKGQEIKK